MVSQKIKALKKAKAPVWGLAAAAVFYCASSASAGGVARMERQAGEQQIMQQRMYQQQMHQAAGRQNAQAADVAGLDEVIASLNHSGRAWTLIIDAEAKAAVVSYYIGQFARQGIKIQLPPMYYVHMIDGMAQSEPQMLQNPFPQILQVTAILEYDFDNGQNKDALVLQVLGSREAVMKNRERLMQIRGQ